jgi:large subunit ribosomal protein L27
MAHTKAKGTTKLGRDSASKRLGIKIYGGSAIKCGQIIVRQRGTAYYAGENVKTGKDDTLYATKDGIVIFKKVRYANFNGNKKLKQRVSVEEISKSKVQSSNKIQSSKAKTAAKIKDQVKI